MTKHRKRKVGSVANELLQKSREAALAAVQIFNSPTLLFKAEIYVVLMHIAWTYLLHAYYRKKRIEYRYFTQTGKQRRFSRTKSGAFKYWELERCLNCDHSPVDKDTANNLRFLIGLRHEIEHQMTRKLDDHLSARFQACCLNYNEYVKKLFGDKHAIDRHLTFSLQFTSLSSSQAAQLETTDLPEHIQRFIEGFDGALNEAEFCSQRFAYRVLFVAKTANRKGQADQVIEFVRSDSDLAKSVNAEYVALKEVEKPKLLPGQIVKLMQEDGFSKFNMHHHYELWQSQDAKNPSKGYGCQVAKTWYWYEPWVAIVKQHCLDYKAIYQ
jgi:hypothetical protein